VSGGTGVIPGKVEVSPEILQYWTEYIGGGVASFLRRAYGTGVNGAHAVVDGAWGEFVANDVRW